jgi:uncharacterized protein (DUF3820 family)
MPFGKYSRGAQKCVMGNVPASYLLWLWNEGKKAETYREGPHGAVARYIERNLDTLKKDAPDVIVDRKE